MTTYARIQDGVVVELFETDGDIAEMFHPSLVWEPATEGVTEGWLFAEGAFSAPPDPEPDPAPADRPVLRSVIAERVIGQSKAAAFGTALAADPVMQLRWISNDSFPANDEDLRTVLTGCGVDANAALA